MAQKLLDGLNVSIPGVNFGAVVGLPEGGKANIQQVEKVADKVVNKGTDLIFDVSLALSVLVGGWLISRWLATQVQNVLQRARVEETLAAFLGSFSRYVFFFVCAVVALQIMGVDKTSLIAVLGATGLAVAFALRETLSHVAAGVMLMVSHPFRVGDYITVGTQEGTVKRLTLFSTELNTIGKQRVFVPNSLVWDNALVNHTYNTVRSVDLRVTVGYDDDVDSVEKLLKKTLEADPHVLKDPEVFVGVDVLGDYGITYLMRIHANTSDYAAVRYGLLGKVKNALVKAGMTIPYPTHMVNLATVEGPKKVLKRK